jgi:hypothetical protein
MSVDDLQHDDAVADEWSFTVPMDHICMFHSAAIVAAADRHQPLPLEAIEEEDDTTGVPARANTTTTTTTGGDDEATSSSSSSATTGAVSPGLDHRHNNTTTTTDWNILRDTFQRNGYVALVAANDEHERRCRGPVVPVHVCDELNRRLEEILRGRFPTGVPPSKIYPRPIHPNLEYEGSEFIRPKINLSRMTVAERRAVVRPPPQAIVGPLGYHNNGGSSSEKKNVVKVRQVVNAHRSDPLFRRVVVDLLGPLVGRFMQHQWPAGVRLASDQVWAKPPQSHPLAFHRDTPYFMFDPPDVVTVWLALDDMDAELGPLHYVTGSHQWWDEEDTDNDDIDDKGDHDKNDDELRPSRQVGAMAGFFDESSKQLLQAARGRKLDIISMAGLLKGGIAIHDGRIWHGSPGNASLNRPRRGLGIHYVPAQVKFTKAAQMSQLWRPFVQDVIAAGGNVADVPVPLEHFPIVWRPTSSSSPHDNDTPTSSTVSSSSTAPPPTTRTTTGDTGTTSTRTAAAVNS